MKNSLFFFLILIQFSCSKEGFREPRLTTLVEINDFSSETHKFIYDAEDKLIRIETKYLTSLEKREFVYSNGKVIKQNKYSNEVLQSYDSLIYNTLGQLSQMINFIPDKNFINEFEYDTTGKLSLIRFYSLKIPSYISIWKCFWDGENISKLETYRNGKIDAISHFLYDNKRNYLKIDPENWRTPESWNKNNIIHVSSKFFDLNYDDICNPCTISYQYDYFGNVLEVNLPFNELNLLSYN